jgi:hypothetical protein
MKMVFCCAMACIADLQISLENANLGPVVNSEFIADETPLFFIQQLIK